VRRQRLPQLLYELHTQNAKGSILRLPLAGQDGLCELRDAFRVATVERLGLDRKPRTAAKSEGEAPCICSSSGSSRASIWVSVRLYSGGRRSRRTLSYSSSNVAAGRCGPSLSGTCRPQHQINRPAIFVNQDPNLTQVAAGIDDLRRSGRTHRALRESHAW
jgi:hypothetical protein